MALMDALDKNELKELITKNWMTHDAMWFYFSAQENGMEKTNRINRMAVRAMAAMEAKRILKASGRTAITGFDELKEFFLEGADFIKAKFMNYEVSFPEKNRMRWDIPGCFAFDGLSKAGLIAGYECGIVERAIGWFDAFGIRYECAPGSRACQMRDTGRCAWEFTFFFD